MTDTEVSNQPIFEAPPMRLKACRHGAMLYNVNDIYIGRSFDMYGEYSEQELSFLGNFVKPGQIVFDVGANIGAHTVFFAKMVGAKGFVMSFEPQRQVFQTLCANVALNALTNVVTFHAGVGIIQRMAKVPVLDYNSEENFGGVSLLDQKGTEIVQIMNLDGIGLPAPLSLIKIDVEGMEMDVLKGATKTIAKHMPILYVENDRKERSPELLEHIMAAGYRVYWHLPKMYNPDNFFGNQDCVFTDILSVNILCVPENAEQPDLGLQEVQSASEFPAVN